MVEQINVTSNNKQSNNTLNVSQLITQIKQCTLCADQLPLPPKPIIQASTLSKILVAGQAPGIVTHKKGIPFDDKSGDRLRAWLGISRETFYDKDNFAILPMGFCYPGKGNSGDLPPLKQCTTTWRNTLLAQLSGIEFTIIIGKYAIDWHTKSKASVTELTKQWQQLMVNNIIVLPHPSPRNNIWLKKNPWFEQSVIPALQEKVSTLLCNN